MHQLTAAAVLRVPYLVVECSSSKLYLMHVEVYVTEMYKSLTISLWISGC